VPLSLPRFNLAYTFSVNLKVWTTKIQFKKEKLGPKFPENTPKMRVITHVVSELILFVVAHTNDFNFFCLYVQLASQMG
jgi:hypothetical protein